MLTILCVLHLNRDKYFIQASTLASLSKQERLAQEQKIKEAEEKAKEPVEKERLEDFIKYYKVTK